MDLISYRVSWESKATSRIREEKQKIEHEIRETKQKYMRKEISRQYFYSNFEKLSLNLQQLQNCLKYRKL